MKFLGKLFTRILNPPLIILSGVAGFYVADTLLPPKTLEEDPEYDVQYLYKGQDNAKTYH